MRVIHFVPGRPFGGIQKLVGQLVELQQHSLDVSVVMPAAEAPSTRTIRRIELHSALASSETLAAVRAADIVHVHSTLSGFFALSALKRQPWVFHAHNYYDDTLAARTRLNRHLLLRRCDTAIAVSDSVAMSLPHHEGCPIHVVPNGIQLPENVKTRTLQGSPRFGLATRLSPDKGLLEALELMCAIRRRFPAATLSIAGTGSFEDDLRERISALGLGDCVNLVGFVDGVGRFYSELDFVLTTAPREAFGLRILEPLALGVPVVGYLTGAGSDTLLRAGKNAGCLTATWCDSESLAEYVVASTKEYSTLSAAAIAFAQRFSVAAMYERVLRVYEALSPRNEVSS